MFIRSICLTAMLAMAVCNTANATVISTYTDRTAWETALTGALFFEETFSGAASSFAADSNANSAGLVTVDLIGGGSDPGPTGLTGNGFFQSEVDSDAPDDLGINFNFLPAIGIGLLGLQNDSVATPGGLNLVEIALMIDGNGYLITDLLDLTDSSIAVGNIGNQISDAAIPFIGFVMDIPISSFSIVHADQVYAGGVQGNSEEYYLDGLVLAQASSVPEPGTLMLLFSGLAGLAMTRRGVLRRSA